MPRRKFLADLSSAAQPGLFEAVSNIRPGDDDGSIKFTLGLLSHEIPQVEIVALIPNLDDYPSEHTYILFTEHAENAPPAICAALERLSPRLSALTLSEMIEYVITSIRTPDGNTSGDTDNQQSGEEDEEDEFIFSCSDDDECFPDSFGSNGGRQNLSNATRHGPNLRRLRADLRIVKAAGFKVGIHGNLNRKGYICVSHRIGTLGISPEAMKAWGVKAQQYFMLLVHYRFGYVSLEDALKSPDPGLQYRLVLCENYKPGLTDIINKFAQPSKYGEEHSSRVGLENLTNNGIEETFISKPLNELMNKRFLSILRARQKMGSWTEAEMFFNDSQGRVRNKQAISTYQQHSDSVHNARHLPKVVTADHLAEDQTNFSLPLCMMQFSLRHFVRCTEFCLNCHCRIDASFEALKPYVCSKPLCLYQFMHLGFGPSIEWEILSQPFVVDLLISFCYMSAKSLRLKDFPNGLGLMTPHPDVVNEVVDGVMPKSTLVLNVTTSSNRKGASTKENKARLELDQMELIFSDKEAVVACPYRVGSWLMVKGSSDDEVYHVRIESVQAWPTVQLTKQPTTPSESTSSPGCNVKPCTTKATIQVTCHPYDTEFDNLQVGQKCHAILMFLKAMPDTLSMKAYLESCNNKDASLSNWQHRLSPYALDVLRWIIASNRSCIVQVDELSDPDQPADSAKDLDTKSWRTGEQIEERVYGMNDWIQFRFAQGAPDKEQRFVDSLKIQNCQSKEHPTLFAWHGSPLQNWHAIIREGLNFNETFHGRAYGHGVYLSQDYAVSASYLHANSTVWNYPGGQDYSGWPQSRLKVSSAIALNEVVNDPGRFVSKSPHLVINQLDWIQTRYLFVRGEPKLLTNQVDVVPDEVYRQDPQWTCLGLNRKAVLIPIAAISSSRRPGAGIEMKGRKRLKTWELNWNHLDDDDLASISTTASDRELLFDSDDDNEDCLMNDTPLATSTPSSDPSVTRFIPGTLKPGGLPLLQAPVTGSSTSSKTLQRELRSLVGEQKSKAQHELGWHIDENLISNMYQWIVEMHSFDLTLPLAIDMEKLQIQSIVLELRFPDNYPLAPPFIRVIQPRFLDFNQGGGGHVTAGGALCMELLTNNGWSPVASIESVLLQVRMELTSTDPPARLANGRGRVNGDSSYGWKEAVDAYLRACRVHGWKVPEGFSKLASTSADK